MKKSFPIVPTLVFTTGTNGPSFRLIPPYKRGQMQLYRLFSVFRTSPKLQFALESSGSWPFLGLPLRFRVNDLDWNQGVCMFIRLPDDADVCDPWTMLKNHVPDHLPTNRKNKASSTLPGTWFVLRK